MKTLAADDVNDDSAALRSLARRLDPASAHALQVRRNALDLFDALGPIHGLTGRDRAILEAAALLHDIGYTKGPVGHHKTARDMILAMDIPGLDEEERTLAALTARYHRKSHPRPEHKLYRDLPHGDQDRVRRLAAILRMGDGLDRAHEASVSAIEAAITSDVIEIRVRQRKPIELDIWGANRKRELAEEVFGRAVRIVRMP